MAKKYIVESWIQDRREYNTLKTAQEKADDLKKFGDDGRKDISIIEVETTEKKL